jgi:putative membrane protein
MLAAILTAWATATFSLWLAALLMPGVRVASFVDAVWAGALLGFLQWLLYWPLFVLLGIGTLGIGFILFFITRWVVAALVILLTARLSRRLQVDSFWWALLTAFLTALTGSVIQWLI